MTRALRSIGLAPAAVGQAHGQSRPMKSESGRANAEVRQAGLAERPVSVLERAVALLASFETTDDELSLSELARRSGIPKTTVHRLTSQLSALGLLEQTEHGAHRLGLRLFEMGQVAVDRSGLVSIAGPVLADLYLATGATVHLAVLDGVEVLYLLKLAPSGAPMVPSRIGGRMPAYCTGVGKALLAFAPQAQIARCLQTGMRRRTSRTIVTPNILLAQLRDVRNGAFAFEYEESASGIVCVATPVLDRSGSPVAAISIAERLSARGTRHLETALQAAASRIGQRMP